MSSSISAPENEVSEAPPGALKVWLLAARPKTLWAGAAPVMMGTAMAWAAGGFHLAAALCTLAAALLIQIGTNFANDYFDFVKGADTADRVGPMRATQAGLISPGAMRNGAILVLVLAFALGLYLVYRGGWPILVIGILSILFAVLYTGGPYPLAYVGLGDVFVLIFFGPIAVGGTHFVQTQEWSALALAAGLGPGLLSTAILAVNNLRDADGDGLAGKRTLAVRLGKRFARAEYAFCVVAATLGLPIALSIWANGHWFVLISGLALLPALPLMTRVYTEEGPALNAVLGGTGKVLLIYALLFSVGWLL